MEPNKFRESRVAINRVCENINDLIAKKSLEESKAKYKKVNTLLDKLKPKAEGEIQKRSVKNLKMKIKALATQISKLKPKKSASKKNGGNGTSPAIVWDEKRVGQLSDVYLEKVFSNMENDTDASVCFGTTGKGIRPSYQIEFGNQDKTAFSGSGHSPLKKKMPSGTKKLSQPFSHDVIHSILNKK